MRITRIGLTPVKGGRHQDLPSVDLTLDGPVGDRVFCLVDPARGRVLRTVENPSLLRTSATWYGGVLTVALPGGTVQDVPVPTGENLEADYWGRVAALDVVDGPWAAAYSEHLGTDVVLARSTRPGDVVYGASVTLVTTSSLATLADHVGAPVDGAQFRSTFTVEVGDAPAHVEDDWVGGTLRLGAATVRVRGVVPRCAVVDLDPVSGQRSRHVMKALGGYRQQSGEVVFGVDAVVTKPGRVDVDAHVERV
ncbi:MAG TPA: MOSC N-terminal beta barrel domain-containing protein [Actinomycetota bacterium]|nr:MOSC N-terminal beta barrel domain-containing protein [Actinomycetota bacterium]